MTTCTLLWGFLDHYAMTLFPFLLGGLIGLSCYLTHQAKQH